MIRVSYKLFLLLALLFSFTIVLSAKPVNDDDIKKALGTLKYSEDNIKGNILFRDGKISEAKEVFRNNRSQSGFNGVYARFLYACLLFEEGKYQEAKNEFDWIIINEDRVASAILLSKLCERKIKISDEDLFSATIDEFDKIGSFRDIAIAKILGKDAAYQIMKEALDEVFNDENKSDYQMSAKADLDKGILFFEDENKLDALLKQKGDDEKTLAGVSILLLRKKPMIELLESRIQKDKKSILLRRILLENYRRELQLGKKVLNQLMNILLGLKNLEPENSFYDYLLAYYLDYKDGYTESEKPFSDAQIDYILLSSKKNEFNMRINDMQEVAEKALRELNNPMAAAASHVAFYQSEMVTFFNISSRIKNTVRAQLSKGLTEKAIETASQLFILADKVNKHGRCRENDYIFFSCEEAGIDCMIEIYTNLNDKNKLDEYKEKKDSLKKRGSSYSKADASLLDLPFIPIPSLSGLLKRKMLDNERLFLKKRIKKSDGR